jgi:hypothetical protein
MYECRYIGPNMADLVSEATLAATGRACREIVGSGTRRSFEVARDATPIESGATREAWIEHPVMPRETGGYEGRVSNASNVAAYLEWGTRPHVEEGHEYMTWVDPLSGRRTSARRVVNPWRAMPSSQRVLNVRPLCH